MSERFQPCCGLCDEVHGDGANDPSSHLWLVTAGGARRAVFCPPHQREATVLALLASGCRVDERLGPATASVDRLLEEVERLDLGRLAGALRRRSAIAETAAEAALDSARAAAEALVGAKLIAHQLDAADTVASAALDMIAVEMAFNEHPETTLLKDAEVVQYRERLRDVPLAEIVREAVLAEVARDEISAPEYDALTRPLAPLLPNRGLRVLRGGVDSTPTLTLIR